MSFLSPPCPPCLVVSTLQISLRSDCVDGLQSPPQLHNRRPHLLAIRPSPTASLRIPLGDIFQLVSLPSVLQLLSTLHLESQMRPGHQLLAVHCLEEEAQVLLHSIQGALLLSCSF